MTNDYHLEFDVRGNDVYKLHLAYVIPLPSLDEATTKFSAEFSDKYNLHRPCGRYWPYDRDGRGDRICDYCSSKTRKFKKTPKRTFDQMFNDLNN
jgi:bisphosphoglycerate-independent phosphoglycerate mutase (AlkP superfamily)